MPIPVVLVHSLGTDRHLWDGVCRASGHAGALRFDLRRPEVSTPGIDEYADALAEQLAQRSPEAAIVVGVSVGGLVAQALAVRHPERVAALVLSNTGLRIGTAELWQDRIAAVRKDGMAAHADGIVARWFSDAWRHAHPQRVVEFRDALVRRDPADYLALCAALARCDLAAKAGRIALPCLCIAGSRDLSTPPASLLELQAALTCAPGGAGLTVIEGAGHLPMVDAEAAFVALLQAFIQEVGDS